MIIGAFYWALLSFGGVLVLLSLLGLFEELQQQHLDIGGIGFAVALGIIGAVIAAYSARALRRSDAGFFGVRAGPEFQRTHIAGSGCLFVILVVGFGLLLYGPIVLFQLPGMAAADQQTFGIGAAVSTVLGATLVGPAGISLWRRRDRSPDAATGRLVVGVVVGILTVLIGGALLLATIFDPRYDVGPAGQLAIGAIAVVGVIVTAGSGLALRQSLR